MSYVGVKCFFPLLPVFIMWISHEMVTWSPWNLSFRQVLFHEKTNFLILAGSAFDQIWLGRLTDCTHWTGQFTPKMKANAKPRLLSSLVWIDSGVVAWKHSLESFFHEMKWNDKFHGIHVWLKAQFSQQWRQFWGPMHLLENFPTGACPQTPKK